MPGGVPAGKKPPGAIVQEQKKKRPGAPAGSGSAELDAMLAAMGGMTSDDIYSDAYAQVSGPYQAQLEALQAQAEKARRDRATGDRELASMYGGLANAIKGDEKGIIGNYNNSWESVRRNTNSGVQAINKTYSDSNNELASLFKSLGIEAAFGDATSGSAKDRGLLAGIVNANGNNMMQGLTTDKAAALQFNTAQGHAAQLQGKNRRADLLTQLNDRLAGIGTQQNQVRGDMSSAINTRAYQMEQDASSRQMQLQQMLLEAQQATAEASAGGRSATGLTPAQEYSQMGPTEKGAYKAKQLFGDDGKAAFAMQLINGVANNQNGGVYENIGHFIRSILAEDKKQAAAGNFDLDDAELQALASYFWDQGGTGRRVPYEMR